MPALPDADPAKLVVQVAVPIVPARSVQVVPVNEPPIPDSPNETVPAGVIGEPPFDELSTTVAKHVEGWLTTTGETQLTDVVVARRFKTMLVAVLWLPTWMLSPP
jgi:hypothetical protein